MTNSEKSFVLPSNFPVKIDNTYTLQFQIMGGGLNKRGVRQTT